MWCSSVVAGCSGAVAANAEVSIYVGGVAVGRTVADASGHYAFPLPPDVTPGTHQVRVPSEVHGVRSRESGAASGSVDEKRCSHDVVEPNGQAPVRVPLAHQF